MKINPAEELLARHMEEANIGFVREFRFAPPRRWKFDFALAAGHPCVAIEIEGGIWSGGRHQRPAGMIADMQKYNHAALMGWRVLRFTTEQVMTGEAIKFIKEVAR